MSPSPSDEAWGAELPPVVQRWLQELGERRGEAEGYAFRLYVAGAAPNSVQAITNLKAVCETHLREAHTLEIVDILTQPKRALADGVLVTPTLVKLTPAPVRKVVGNLSNTAKVLAALGLPGRPA